MLVLIYFIIGLLLASGTRYPVTVFFFWPYAVLSDFIRDRVR
jgi:hypothetical protein